MNRTHRIIWCSIRKMKVVVAENAGTRNKGGAAGKAGKRAVLGAMACPNRPGQQVRCACSMLRVIIIAGLFLLIQ